MRSVLQRVNYAAVRVDGIEIAHIGKGILALVGISREDTLQDLEWMARKIIELRIFDDAEGKLNLNLQDIGGEILLVSQFTLYGDCRKGRRPSYSEAAPPAEAEKLYEKFVSVVRGLVPAVQSGKFQAMMDVELVNAGPVTLLLDSRGKSV